MKVLTKGAAVVAALFRGLGVELHPKVAATPVGAAGAGVVLAALSAAGVHVPEADGAVLAVVCTILAGYLHPAAG
jgi:hypothetical protein